MSTINPGAFRAKYGPWAVIAGGSDGTGADFARQIAATGINCVLAARRLEPLEKLATELRSQHKIEVRAVQLDLASDGAAEKLHKACEGLEVGLYVANAGADTNGSLFLDTPLEAWRKLLRLNVQNVVDACYYFAAPMKARGRGGLVLMSSGAGLGGGAGIAIYSAAKAALLAFAESLWAELQPHGVDVVSCAAPLMDTPTLRRSFGGMNAQVESMAIKSDAVVRETLERLANGPLFIYPMGPDAAHAEQTERTRRQRVIAMAEMTKTIFANPDA